MRVKCISEFPTDDQIAQLGEGFSRNQSFHITVGKEYLVLGIVFHKNSSLFGTGTYFECAYDWDHLGWAPMCLFDIVDDRVSRFWKAHAYDDGTFALKPASFYHQYYHDDLSEDTPEIVEDFKRVRTLLQMEDSNELES